MDSRGSILVAMYNSSNGRRNTSVGAQNAEESVEIGTARMQPQVIRSDNMPVTRRVTMPGYSVSQAQKFKAASQSFNIDNRPITEENMRAFSTPPFDIGPSNISQSHLEIAYRIDQARRLGDSSFSFKENSSLPSIQ